MRSFSHSRSQQARKFHITINLFSQHPQHLRLITVKQNCANPPQQYTPYSLYQAAYIYQPQVTFLGCNLGMLYDSMNIVDQ